MKRRTTRLIAIATVTGALAGGAIAALEPVASGGPTDPPYRAPSAPLAVDASPPAAPARTSYTLAAVPGSTVLEARTPDPAGGPDWAVRVFDARTRRPARDGGAIVTGSGRSRCAQLVRVVGGHAGWIDGDDHFRRVAAGSFDAAPQACAGLRWQRHHTFVGATTLVDAPMSATPVARGMVIWSFSADRVTAPRLRVDGRRVAVRPSRQYGSFVTFGGPRADPSTVALTVRRWDGARRAATPLQYWQASARAMRAGQRLAPGTVRVVARAADPGGGPTWGLLTARSVRGGWCPAVAGQIVGDRVGRINAVLGTFDPQRLTLPPGDRCLPTQGPRPSARQPVVLVPWAAGADPSTGTVGTQSSALRLQPSRTVTVARTLPSVRSVTFATGTTVRTLAPESDYHAFLVVSDARPAQGLFLGWSKVRLTVRFDDGRTRTLSQSVPG